MHYRCSSSFAFFWNLCKSVVPDEIIDDFTSYLSEIGIGRMDADGAMPCNANGKGSYSITLQDDFGEDVDIFNFSDVELAPPTGVSSENYAR